MPVDYRVSQLVIRNFRGIADLEIDFRRGQPTVLIGANNAGKSTILNALALAFHNGEFYNWSPSETDFYCSPGGTRATEFAVQVHFEAAEEDHLPAVRTIGSPHFVHGIRVHGRTLRNGSLEHSRTLIGSDGKPITLNTRTKQSQAEKTALAGHNVGWQTVYARLDQIREHVAETWYFKPGDIEAALYVWKTGPIAKLSKYLAERFLSDRWTMSSPQGDREMPATLENGYRFFQQIVAAFPFWKDTMKPDLERIFGRYVGDNAKIDLSTSTQSIQEWLAQQLVIHMATDPQNAPTPLRTMGDGWQSVIRLAALEALTLYPSLVRERVILLMEEPETHLHPHLRRKIRKVLCELAAKGWTIVYTTHSSELVSFEEGMSISRLVRTDGMVAMQTVGTDDIEAAAKLQSKLDDNGAHDFLFGTATVLCEGAADAFAIRLGLDRMGFDLDGRSVSVTQCGSCTAIPSFAYIASKLGIKWCAVTDEDLLPDGSIKPQTERQRAKIEEHRQANDLQVMWPGDLEICLGIAQGSAEADKVVEKLRDAAWETSYPDFRNTLVSIAGWIDPRIR